MTIDGSALDFPFGLALHCDELLAKEGGLRGVGGNEIGFVGGCKIFQFAEPYLESEVCHSPSASTKTSSTLSGHCFKIESKYLQNN